MAKRIVMQECADMKRRLDLRIRTTARGHLDELLDLSLEDTFPASDPISMVSPVKSLKAEASISTRNRDKRGRIYRRAARTTVNGGASPAPWDE